MIGQILGNYKVTQKIGAGGQGTVYKAIDQKLGRTVVVKVLPPELTVKEANLKRFEREARLASSLDHPNICTIFDMDEVGGLHFITMQYVEGRNVRQLVNGRPLELESALRIAIQVADALAAAHARGIIHRDIKSGNIMVTDAGQAKILDYALQKEPRGRYQKIGELRDELRSVLHEIASGAQFEEATAPRHVGHLGGSSPVGRAMRWLRKLGGSGDTQTSAPQLLSKPVTDPQ